jgi:hypothetical protein
MTASSAGAGESGIQVFARFSITGIETERLGELDDSVMQLPFAQ